MTTATYSAVLDHPVETVWSLIRDFNNYPAYIDGVTESIIEDDRRGDEIGAIRRFLYGGNWIRQRLAGHSDEQRALTYVGMDPFPFPAGLLPEAPVNYQGTIHLQRIVDGERTFIEWSVALDAEPGRADSCRNLVLSLISDWTGSLKGALARNSL
jgi:polyketide cyclase/dehydrase/lipid transport protein